MTGPNSLLAKLSPLAGVFAGVLVLFAASADAATETVLYSFQNNGKDGYLPAASLIEANGALFGTTTAGGTGRCNNGCGTIFSVNETTGAETILHSFSNIEQMAAGPGPLLQAGGTLFGSTSKGGRRDDGMLFSFNLASNKFKDQYYFCNLENCSDGEYPNPSLLDEKGILYGTTEDGGLEASGTVFSYDPKTRIEKTLHSFGAAGDGSLPFTGLLRVGRKLYGTTYEGGASYYGAVFSIDTATGKESVIYSFCSQQNCTDGERPYGNLVYLNQKIYGTTSGGGVGYGTVFSIDPATHAETVLYSFEGAGSGDGANPSGLIYANGLLYGTTAYGGANCAGGCGTAYSVDPQTGAEAVIYSFCNQVDCADGVAPQSSLLSLNGALYGVTSYGGSGSCTAENEVAGCGVVFAITP